MKLADFHARQGGPQLALAQAPSPWDERWVLPVEHLSATSLNMLQRCPRQFQVRYVHGVKEAPGQARVLGSAFHGAQEHNWRQKIASHEDVPTEQVVEFFHDKAWPTAIEAVGGAEEVAWDGDPEDARKTGALMTAAYREQVSERIQPLAVEQKREIQVGLPVPLLGYLDVLTEGPTIDMKTSSKKVSKAKPDWRLQGRIYRLMHPRPVDWHIVTKAKQPTVWTPLEADQLHEPYSLVEATETARHVRRLAEVANHYMTIYGPDDPWPATGIAHDWACGWCGYRSSCPAWKGEL